MTSLLRLPPDSDPDRLDTWTRYRKGLCDSCQAICCSLPVEVRLADLVRLGLADPFETAADLKAIARRLRKSGEVEHYNTRSGLLTLSRDSAGDCLYLDKRSRRCTRYADRPDTCRNHPQIGPRPGHCAYRQKRAP